MEHGGGVRRVLIRGHLKRRISMSFNLPKLLFFLSLSPEYSNSLTKNIYVMVRKNWFRNIVKRLPSPLYCEKDMATLRFYECFILFVEFKKKKNLIA